jgi:hypothetical protein
MKTVNLGIRTLGTAAVNICVLVILATSPNSTLNLCVMIYNPCIWVRSYEYPNIRDIITETPTSPLTPSSLLAVPLCVLVVRDHPISFSSVWAPRGPNVPGQLLWTSKRRYPVRSGIDGLDFATSSSIRSKAAQATPLPRTPSPSTRGAAAGATIHRRVAEREKIVPLLPLTNTCFLLPTPHPSGATCRCRRLNACVGAALPRRGVVRHPRRPSCNSVHQKEWNLEDFQAKVHIDKVILTQLFPAWYDSCKSRSAARVCKHDTKQTVYLPLTRFFFSPSWL